MRNAVQVLLAQCEAYDHSVVAIQFDHSFNYFPDMNSWFLYFEEEELVGVLSVFSPLADVAEISGCMKPAQRNAGKFNELITAYREELDKHSIGTILFVVDGDSKTGMDAIAKRQLKCDHVEYLMNYRQFKEEYKSTVRLREAELTDVDNYIVISSALFHDSRDESRSIVMSCLHSKDRKLYVAEIDNITIGICTLFYAENKVTIYGLGIAEAYQGKGYGRDLLHSILNLLKDKPYEVELEVDSLNEKAYSLYKTAGFKEKRVVNYYIGL